MKLNFDSDSFLVPVILGLMMGLINVFFDYDTENIGML